MSTQIEKSVGCQKVCLQHIICLIYSILMEIIFRNRGYIDRRRILNEVISQSNNKNNKRIRISDYIEQEGIVHLRMSKK